MPRLKVDIEARSNFELPNNYHYKLRGALWSKVENTFVSEFHGNPISFTYSNIFPWEDCVDEGSRKSFFISSPFEDIIDEFDKKLLDNQEFLVGEMDYIIRDSKKFSLDVGEFGNSGSITTSTGVVVPIPKEEFDIYDINDKYNSESVFWVPDNGMRSFKEKVVQDVRWKCQNLQEDYMEKPESFSDLFNSVELIKTYPLKVNVTSDYMVNFILSKWNFEYEVSSSDHRRWLNMLMNCGIGRKNNYGFGFLNPLDGF